jgi:hypothetical protein
MSDLTPDEQRKIVQRARDFVDGLESGRMGSYKTDMVEDARCIVALAEKVAEYEAFYADQAMKNATGEGFYMITGSR